MDYSDTTLRYEREELLTLQSNFDINEGTRRKLYETGILHNTAKSHRKLRRGTKGKRKLQIRTIITTERCRTSSYKRKPCTSNLIYIKPTKITKPTGNIKNQQLLPSIFYTNARSLNITKKSDLECNINKYKLTHNNCTD